MTYAPGQSGNPHGRPIKGRGIAALLAAAGAERLDPTHSSTITRQEAMVALVWEGLTTGQITLVGPRGGKKLVPFKPSEWLDLVKFVAVHLDGTIKDVTSGGESLNPTFLSLIQAAQSAPGAPAPDG